jgi:hypothetical protein
VKGIDQEKEKRYPHHSLTDIKALAHLVTVGQRLIFLLACDGHKTHINKPTHNKQKNAHERQTFLAWVLSGQ